MGENRCIMCGAIIPEGRMVCPICEKESENDMVEVLIRLDTPAKVSNFVQLSSKCKGDVDVYDGKYIVSGKSLLGLHSLELTRDLKVEFHGNIPEEVREGMKKFIVN